MDRVPPSQPTVESFPVALIVSKFNSPITETLKNGALERLLARGLLPSDIYSIEVPGAVEIPLIALKLAATKKYKALIALGAVIRGETDHYDYVCQIVSSGCSRVSLDYAIPVIFGILTTENEAQAYDRLGGKHGHKGIEYADSAIEMVQIIKDIG
ncbi:MAG: 6,7-dimethyl-8-ribityllumazine synthase [Legionellales bacterium RIFCSPHIGHO2_12_FULL_37_14]|nr:MAG: 6,7-dimethyl-8-ribityllumazine synthase [Legionellales bacterium RIFCSPHIGHO2_12_FULL_37_14]